MQSMKFPGRKTTWSAPSNSKRAFLINWNNVVLLTIKARKDFIVNCSQVFIPQLFTTKAVSFVSWTKPFLMYSLCIANFYFTFDSFYISCSWIHELKQLVKTRDSGVLFISRTWVTLQFSKSNHFINLNENKSPTIVKLRIQM